MESKGWPSRRPSVSDCQSQEEEPRRIRSLSLRMLGSASRAEAMSTWWPAERSISLIMPATT